MNWYIWVPTPNGCGPPNVAQPISLPYSSPGKIDFLLWELTTGLYMVSAAATWGAVRHDAESALVHSRALGSNLHCLGFSRTRSLTPSFASQACNTAS